MNGARSHAGFSLIELIMVITVTGVLAVVALPKFFDTGAFERRGYFDESLAAVRYAQKQAIAWGCDVQVSFGAGGYALTRRDTGCDATDCTVCTFTTPVGHPSKPGGYAAAPPAGVAVGTATFHFDRIGRPRSPGGALLSANTDIAIGADTLRVSPETGFARKAP